MCHATGLTVAHLLGHASTQILPTYVRPLDENTRALIEALNAARKKQRESRILSTEQPSFFLAFAKRDPTSTLEHKKWEIPLHFYHVFITASQF
jgi:hypothetical protein